MRILQKDSLLQFGYRMRNKKRTFDLEEHDATEVNRIIRRQDIAGHLSTADVTDLGLVS